MHGCGCLLLKRVLFDRSKEPLSLVHTLLFHFLLQMICLKHIYPDSPELLLSLHFATILFLAGGDDTLPTSRLESPAVRSAVSELLSLLENTSSEFRFDEIILEQMLGENHSINMSEITAECNLNLESSYQRGFTVPLLICDDTILRATSSSSISREPLTIDPSSLSLPVMACSHHTHLTDFYEQLRPCWTHSMKNPVGLTTRVHMLYESLGKNALHFQTMLCIVP